MKHKLESRLLGKISIRSDDADDTTIMAKSKEGLKRLFSSLLSAIRVVSSVCLGLLIFFLEILILACASSSLAFHMMYSALG